MDNLLKEAEEDLEKLKLEGSHSGTADTDLDNHSDSGLADIVADLDVMMKQSNAELALLMNP